MRVRAWVAVILLVGAGLVAAGYLGRGPLAALAGVRVTHVEVEGVRGLSTSGDPLVLVVVFPWPHDGFCSGQFTASVQETDREVRVGQVTSVEHRGGACAGLGTQNGWAGASLTLDRPVGTRAVVRASDGALLPVVTP